MTAEDARFSVLYEDQVGMHLTGFDDALAARRFAHDQRDKGFRIVAVFTPEGVWRRARLEKWLEESV